MQQWSDRVKMLQLWNTDRGWKHKRLETESTAPAQHSKKQLCLGHTLSSTKQKETYCSKNQKTLTDEICATRELFCPFLQVRLQQKDYEPQRRPSPDSKAAHELPSHPESQGKQFPLLTSYSDYDVLASLTRISAVLLSIPHLLSSFKYYCCDERFHNNIQGNKDICGMVGHQHMLEHAEIQNSICKMTSVI